MRLIVIFRWKLGDQFPLKKPLGVVTMTIVLLNLTLCHKNPLEITIIKNTISIHLQLDIYQSNLMYVLISL